MSSEYDRKLTDVELKIMDELIEKNQLLDPLFLESLFKMDPAALHEIVKAHKAGVLEDPYPNKVFDSNIFKIVEVLDESEANPIIESVKIEQVIVNDEVVIDNVIKIDEAESVDDARVNAEIENLIPNLSAMLSM